MPPFERVAWIASRELTRKAQNNTKRSNYCALIEQWLFSFVCYNATAKLCMWQKKMLVESAAENNNEKRETADTAYERTKTQNSTEVKNTNNKK